MRSAEFYFALPRLLTHWSGFRVLRSERNWLEANVVGSFVHLIAYVYAFQILLAGLPMWQRCLLSVPLAFVVWIFWLVVLYLDSLIIKLLRAFGLMKTTLDRGAQGFLICVVTTVFAWQIILAGSWWRVIGWVWIVAVTLNFLAALVLSTDRDHAAAN